MHTVTVDKITVVGGARTTRVKRDGEVIATHGLGAVGEPLAPYLGERAEGWSLVLPDDIRDLAVFHVDTDGPLLPNGRFRVTRVPLADLGATDVTLPATTKEAGK